MKSEERGARMRRILTAEFNPILLEIVDESKKHEGHAGSRPEGGTHFRVKIVSEKFANSSKVECHRMVYAALAAEMGEGGIHALALETAAKES